MMLQKIDSHLKLNNRLELLKETPVHSLEVALLDCTGIGAIYTLGRQYAVYKNDERLLEQLQNGCINHCKIETFTANYLANRAETEKVLLLARALLTFGALAVIPGFSCEIPALSIVGVGCWGVLSLCSLLRAGMNFDSANTDIEINYIQKQLKKVPEESYVFN